MKVVLSQEEVIEIVANHVMHELDMFREQDTMPPRRDTAKLLFHDDISQSITFEMNIGDFV